MNIQQVVDGIVIINLLSVPLYDEALDAPELSAKFRDCVDLYCFP